MAGRKEVFETPFKNAIVPPVSSGAKAGDIVDRNMCPYFDEPRAPGHSGEPEVFGVGVKGKNYHGPITDAATLESPMGGAKNEKG